MQDWWADFVENNQAEAEVIASELIDCPVSQVKDYLDEGQTAQDWCEDYDDYDKVYETFIGYNCTETDFGINAEEMLRDMFAQAAPGEYSYEDEFIDDMATHAAGYSKPDGFFKDLAYGGCQSGMIGMLIYHSDCKEVYCRHIDDMEATKEDLEGEMGEPMRNHNHISHPDWMCWLCYEELGHRIASELWPDQF